MTSQRERGRVLVTGATGYVGGRLWRKLEEGGVHVRCMARDPLSLADKVGETTEVVRSDILSVSSLEAALEGIETAYYLIHSMGSAGNFEDTDREGAHNFAQAAERAGVKRIIYLGGLGDASEELSSHLRSRHEVGEILRDLTPALTSPGPEDHSGHRPLLEARYQGRSKGDHRPLTHSGPQLRTGRTLLAS